MQNIPVVLRNISLTLHKLEHTSKKTYFLQSYLTPTNRKAASLHEQRNRTCHGDQTTNIPKSSGGNLSKSLGRFSLSSILHIVGPSITLNCNWDCAYANEFPGAADDLDGVPLTGSYIGLVWVCHDGEFSASVMFVICYILVVQGGGGICDVRYTGVCSSSVSAGCCSVWVCSCCLSISDVYCWWAFVVGSVERR